VSRDLKPEKITPAEAVVDVPGCACCEQCSPVPCGDSLLDGTCDLRCVCPELGLELRELDRLDELEELGGGAR
jgi:hypothetical protein